MLNLLLFFFFTVVWWPLYNRNIPQCAHTWVWFKRQNISSDVNRSDYLLFIVGGVGVHTFPFAPAISISFESDDQCKCCFWTPSTFRVLFCCHYSKAESGLIFLSLGPKRVPMLSRKWSQTHVSKSKWWNGSDSKPTCNTFPAVVIGCAWPLQLTVCKPELIMQHLTAVAGVCVTADTTLPSHCQCHCQCQCVPVSVTVRPWVFLSVPRKRFFGNYKNHQH